MVTYLISFADGTSISCLQGHREPWWGSVAKHWQGPGPPHIITLMGPCPGVFAQPIPPFRRACVSVILAEKAKIR